MTAPPPVHWKKSSRSVHSQCVEAGCGGNTYFVRNTRNRAGGTLRFSDDAWARFVAGIKNKANAQ